MKFVKFKRLDIRSMMVGALSVAVVFLLMSQKADKDLITCRDLQIVDASGTIIATLGQHGDGGVLKTFNTDGLETAFFGTTNDGDGNIVISNSASEQRIILGTDAMGYGQLTTYGANNHRLGFFGNGYLYTFNSSGKRTAYLGLTGEVGSGQLIIYDALGGQNVVLGHQALAIFNLEGKQTVALGSNTETGGGQLRTSSKDGSITGSFEEGTLSTFNKDGNKTVSLGTKITTGNGQIWTYRADGKRASYTGRGFMYFYNNLEKETAFLGTAANETGRIQLTANDGTIVFEK
ncbi:MAG: hypothetical protein IIA45_01355 [Bacteroidetes bacterium]|nr:hypothetical protein [Bacteroidota bacterium]